MYKSLNRSKSFLNTGYRLVTRLTCVTQHWATKISRGTGVNWIAVLMNSDSVLHDFARIVAFQWIFRPVSNQPRPTSDERWLSLSSNLVDRKTGRKTLGESSFFILFNHLEPRVFPHRSAVEAGLNGWWNRRGSRLETAYNSGWFVLEGC